MAIETLSKIFGQQTLFSSSSPWTLSGWFFKSISEYSEEKDIRNGMQWLV